MGVSPTDPTRYNIQFTQGGYPFSSPDFLVGPTNVSAAYAHHIAAQFLNAGVEKTEEAAEEAARRVVAFQTQLARVAMPPEELRVPENVNHPMPLSSLVMLTGLPLDAYLRISWSNETLPETTVVNVGQPTQLAALGQLLRNSDAETLRDVMRWTLLLSFANDLSEEMAAEHFRFFGTTLSGTPKQPTLWKRCQAKAVAWMPDSVGARFMKVAFTPETEDAARTMMRLVQLAFLRRLPSLTWMSSADKMAAADKLTGMAILIGANQPHQRLNFSGLPLSARDHFSNVLILRQFNFNDTKSRLYKTMPASMVNAYYDPSLNSMNFPAGIIQPPFFSEHFPSAWNFGALGSVMGHELTHGFDDEGRKYDRTGRLHPWWSESTAAAFANASSCLVRQYRSFPLTRTEEMEGPEYYIRGFLTLGENLADQGGVTLSYLALQLKHAEEEQRQKQQALLTQRLTVAPAPTESQAGLALMQEVAPALKSLDEQQLFFIAYAQAWCRYQRPSALLRALQHDPHSPSEARVNVPLSNSPEFTQAFQCQPNEEMQQYAQCVAW